MSISSSSSSSSILRPIMTRHSTTTTCRRSSSSSTTSMKNLPTILDMVKERSLHFSEFLTNRLYFVTVSEMNLNFFLKKSDSNVSFLHFDKELLYTPFNHDFGPLNLAMLYRYCKKINSHLQRNKTIIHLTTTNRFKRVNSAYLIGSYCIIYHHLLPDDIMARLKQLSISYLAYKTFTSFVDAGFDTSEYYLHLDDCFMAIYKASITEILNMDRFNLNEYLFYEKVENGDLNWIVPGKFLAFCDPQTYSDHTTNHYIKLYLNYFRKNNIQTIIRLNKSHYDSKMFTDKGFQHYNLIFIDGGVPDDYIVDQFLHIVETTTGAIAVHCKAGLGRTGTMIACYLMKHWHFTAMEAIAWIRICRPGSIVGYQQKWLKLKQNFLWNHNTEQRLIEHQQQQQQKHLQMDLDFEQQQQKQQTIRETGRLQRNGQQSTMIKTTTTTTTKETIAVNNNNNNNEDVDDLMINNNSNDNNNNNNECIHMDDNDVSTTTTTKLTQGDYLNQIKLINSNNNNRKKHLRIKINHWFQNNNHNNQKSSIQSMSQSPSRINNNLGGSGLRKTNQTMMMMMTTPSSSSSDIRLSKEKQVNNRERKQQQQQKCLNSKSTYTIDIDSNNNITK